MKRTWMGLAAAGLAFFAGATAAAAQGIAQRGGLQAATGPSFESYQFLNSERVGIQRLSLMTLPLGVRVQPLDRLSLQVSSAYAQGTLRRTDGTQATLSGLTDTELRASYVLGRDLVVVSAGYLLPTGRTALTLDEAEVAGTIAADLLPFRITQWGSGGGLALSTAVAVPVAGFGVGFSLGYTMTQEFDALDLPGETWKYRPGNELRLRMGIDRSFGRSGKASLIFNLQRYDDDQLQGESLLQPGNRYDATGFYSFAVGTGATGVTYLGIAHRDAGTFAVQNVQIPAQDLLFAGGGLRIPVRVGVLVPSVEGRVFRKDDGLNQGYVGGVGAALEFPVAAFTIIPTARSRFGKVLLWEGEEASFRGGELGLFIRMGTGRL
jgi:hypothetical protein